MIFLNSNSAHSSKILILIVFLVIVILGLVLFNFVYIPRVKNCIFVNKLVCLKGSRFNKYNWQGKLAGIGYKLIKPQKIKAPFDGWFILSPVANINYQNETLGVAEAIQFNSDNFGTMMLVVGRADLLKGQLAERQSVVKGEIVAEILPEGISFLDNFSLIQSSFFK